MLIKDLVWLDEEGKFRNDVQLSHYEDKKINQSLLGCYIFSYDAPIGYLSSAKLLESIIYAYLNPSAHKNRTVVIGQYGHGKSHLGLVMANYFGKPYNSPEFKTVISRLKRAIEQPVKLEKYKEFRKNRPEFLVIRLSGDNPRSIREQFLQALEKAMNEHNETTNLKLPFWQETAKRLLNSLEGDQLEKADKFLENYSTEVVLLAQEVDSYSDQTYQMVIDLFTHIHGVAPNLGGEISMKEILNWAGENFCSKDGPLGGIFILFDEFSLFILNQSKKGGSGELQELLNGVQDQAGKAVFVAFSQHDPKLIARSVLQGVGLDNLEKELNRIEGELILYSLMESVIDAYLTQSDSHWAELRSDPKVKGPLARASNLCMEIFRKRYEDTLRWTPEIFDEIVQKGCFPLHPITTAILCDIQLQAVQKAGNPRTVLGFVERMVRERASEQALLDNGRLNWVHAIELIDYFYDYLPETSKMLYETAKRNLTAESPVEFDMLLKALLLEEIIKIRRNSQTQVEFLAEVSGLKQEVALDNLKKLSRANITRFDSISRINTFMPVSSDPNLMQDLLKKKRKEFAWDWKQMQKLNKLPEFKPLNVSIKWGHPLDWSASQYVITPDFFDEKNLKEITKNFSITSDGLIEGSRGIIIWLLARTAEEVVDLRTNTNKIIDATFNEEYSVPVLVVIPDNPDPELLDAYETLIALKNFNNEERQKVGQAIYQIQITQEIKALKEGIDSLRGDEKLYRNQFRKPNSISAPKAYRALLQSRGEISLVESLSLTYELAYRGAPPEFFTQYKITQLKLRNAVKTIVAVLIKNKLSTSRDMLQTQKVAYDLCDKFLVNSWGILAKDYSIQKPTNNKVLQAWSLLDDEIAVGSKDIILRSLLVKLINPPFGFDYNTAILLISAYIGFNSHEIRFAINGTLNSVDEVVEILTNSKGIKEFLEAVSVSNILSISRINLGDVINEVKEQVKHARRDTFAKNDTRTLIQELEAHSQNEAITEEIRSQASNAAEYLQSALEKAEDYDSKAIDIQNCVNSKKLDNLLTVPRLLEQLPILGNVKVSSPSAEKLREDWNKQLAKTTEQYCQEYECVKELTEVGRNYDILDQGKKDIKRVAPDFVKRFDTALENLKKDEQRLRTRIQEAPVRIEIETMKTARPYIELLDFRSWLEEIKGFSEEIMKLRNEKLSQINTAISQLESYAKLLIENVSDLDSHEDLENWKTQYLQSQNKFEGSLFQNELQTKYDNLEKLHDFYSHLNQIEEMKFLKPEDVDLAFEEMKEIETTYYEWLVEKNKDKIKQILTKIEEKRDKEEAEAIKWAENLIHAANNCNYQLVIQKSKLVPTFLPESHKNTIQELVVKAENEIEKDIVSRIEHEFRQIKDREIQQECLNRLQAIANKKMVET